MQYDFKKIKAVPSGQNLIKLIISKIQAKAPKIVSDHYHIARIRSFYIRRINTAAKVLHKKLTGILASFPKLDDLHPFHADWINILYGRDHFKLAMSHIYSTKKKIIEVARNYGKTLRFMDPPYSFKILKRAALERIMNAAFRRMVTAVNSLESSFGFLNEVRLHMRKLPSINPLERTVIICGIPNTGKTSFFNKITQAKAEVQRYPFTTRYFNVDYAQHEDVRFQVIDTPPLLNRPIGETNTIEKQVFTALAHIKACVLYFMDLSEMCGFSIQDQISLFEKISPSFRLKQLIVVINKIDLIGPDDINPQLLQKIRNLAKQHEAQILAISVQTGKGVAEVKEIACQLISQPKKDKNFAIHGGEEAKDDEPLYTGIEITTPELRDDDNGCKSVLSRPVSKNQKIKLESEPKAFKLLE